MDALIAAGWQPESNVLQASHYSFATLSVGLTYANTYGRFSVKDNLCGYSFGATGAAASATPNAPCRFCCRAGDLVRRLQRRAADHRHQHRQQQQPWRAIA